MRARVVDASAWRKRSKTCGRNVGRDAAAGVAAPRSRVRVRRARRATSTRAAARRELDGVGQQVPDHLLEPARGRPRPGPPRRSIDDVERDRPSASAAGRTRLERGVDDARRGRRGSTSSRSLPVMMRDTSSRSSMSCACARALRSIASSARAPCRSRRCAPGAQQRDPAEDRVRAACAARATASPGTRPWSGSRPRPRRAWPARRVSASRNASSASRARSNARTVATSTAGSMGSVSEASAPPSRARTVSSSRTCVAETWRMATDAVAGSALIRRHTSRPSTPGRFTSSNTSRGERSGISRSASSPVAASMTS